MYRSSNYAKFLKRQSEMYTSWKLELKGQCVHLLMTPRCSNSFRDRAAVVAYVFPDRTSYYRNLLSCQSDPLSLTSIYFVYGLLNELSNSIQMHSTETTSPEPISILLNTMKKHFHCVSSKSNQLSSLPYYYFSDHLKLLHPPHS